MNNRVLLSLNILMPLYFNVFAQTATPVPTISGFSPTMGSIGTSVAIKGKGYSPNIEDNQVFFGSQKATIISCSDSLLNVTVPKGASYSRITVKVGKRSASSHISFNVSDLQSCTPTFYSEHGFSNKTGPYPDNITSGDYNEDGYVDIISSNYNGNSISVLLGNGTYILGSKTDYSTGSNPNRIATSDFNGDGHLDIVTGNSKSNVSVLLGTGTGSFSAKVDYLVKNSSYSVICDDFNGDGYSDIVSSGFNSISVLLGLGNGTFNTKIDSTAGSETYGLTSSDFNNDGRTDLAVTSATNNFVSIYLGNENGLFGKRSDYPIQPFSYTATADDFNNDGIQDLVTTSWSLNTAYLMLGKGDGSFGAGQPYAVGKKPTKTNKGDFNGDGIVDLIVCNKGESTVSILLGTGTGTFLPKIDHKVALDPDDIVVEDFNGDGRHDFATPSGSSNNSIHIYLSQCSSVVTDFEDENIENTSFKIADHQMVIQYLTPYIIDIYTASGTKLETFTGNGERTYNLEKYPTGFYVAKLIGQNTTESVKFFLK